MALQQPLNWASRAATALSLAAAICLGHLLIATLAPAQSSEKTTRKLLTKVEPGYPPDLKRARIGGIVRMDVVVSPRGSVENVSVIGGNPILVDTAVKAVKKWKYATADYETVIRVNVNFDPSK